MKSLCMKVIYLGSYDFPAKEIRSHEAGILGLLSGIVENHDHQSVSEER